MTPALADATLDELRLALAPQIAANAAFDGWNAQALDATADGMGIARDIARLAFSGGAAVEMIDAWFASIDAEMAERLPPETLAAMKIRQRTTALVEARLAIAAPNREALRRAVAILAMPQNARRALRLGWRSADAMWRLAGDTATDYNHYTKRALLGSIYAATIAVFLNDESEDWADTRGFLARRIDGIMAFEKAKSGFLARTQNRPSLSRFVGRLRYPVV
ncbi:COQ9 family protein [Sphingomonas hengshuiensis]|uniref:RpsU-divergently transcribed n=1 Tax=Sphingomonas hengshuiensis TaxID=1609977 RepID=A0A7U4JB30_9SPHN|nr:COQ9 family protein [Sphingomonas hengshuiensis]AJP73548.1 RpsU-divergently transcribed [Sphingomonas hengshuiensis]